MIQVERHLDARAINAVVNDPAVRPFVADASEGVLDLTPQVANRDNILLMGQHGGALFFKLMDGIYELHTQALPAGRGPWLQQFGEACARHMFTATPAVEVLTRIPDGHTPATAAAHAQGFRHEFTRPNGCRWRGRVRDLHVHKLGFADWAAAAPYVTEIGAWFHKRLHEEALRCGITAPPHAEDENHNRYVGASYLMAAGGQPMKAIVLYNRWATVARHRPVALLALDPVTIRFDIGILRLTDDDIVLEVAS